jgi:hypothetical protein
MVKLVIKLVIVALIGHALYQVVPPYYNNWKFQDAMKELATYPGFRPTVQSVQEKCERIAKQHDLDLTRDDFAGVLGAGGKTTTIDTQYTVAMSYIPGKPKEHTFVVHAVGDPPRFGSLAP